MNILLLCWRDTSHPQGGGSERYLERVGEYLARHGHTVTYRTAKTAAAPRRGTAAGVAYRRCGGRIFVYVTAALELMFGAYRDVDVVVDTQNGIPFFAGLFQHKPTIVLTHHCHREQWPVAGPVLARLGWFLESVAAPLAYRRSQYVTVSEPSAVELVELGVDPDRIAIVRNGVDPVPEFDPAPGDDKLHLITLARLVPHKQIEHAMDVLAALVECDAVLDVVGSGWWEEELVDYANTIGVADRVRFHGHVPESRKHALLDQADIHLMPSRKEGWGLAVIEAGQHGVPTVGYLSSAGLQDSVLDQCTGVLVADKAGLIKAVHELAHDPVRRAELGAAAQQRAAEFSWENTGAEFAKVIERVAQVERTESG